MPSSGHRGTPGSQGFHFDYLWFSIFMSLSNDHQDFIPTVKRTPALLHPLAPPPDWQGTQVLRWIVLSLCHSPSEGSAGEQYLPGGLDCLRLKEHQVLSPRGHEQQGASFVPEVSEARPSEWALMKKMLSWLTPHFPMHMHSANPDRAPTTCQAPCWRPACRGK